MVFVPSPAVRVNGTDELKLVDDVTVTKVAAEQSDPFAIRYPVTPTSSVALSATVTATLLVEAVPLLITTDAFAGGVVSAGAAE
jgi:hypothetical protein